ncbi:paraneoplastic antigen Ma2 homolog [Hyperolius riggenbachi]|uniref:paraneoplastic antigen Ma2 homolog n=1 Tax=Hyperolius riggenbachi TaxID=752182 RepID=UPI0035A33A56
MPPSKREVCSASVDSMPTTPGYPPASFYTDMGKLMENLVTNSFQPISYGYRKLRVCSGQIPVPSGEDDFETWIDQAAQALDEWEVSDTVKRQRIVESLRAPASDVVRNLKRDQPGCTATECLDALREVFGQIESCADLIHRFGHTYQEEGERLSTFVTRLDKILHQVIQKKGMAQDNASEALLTQILKGAQPLDPIMLKIQMRDRSDLFTYSKLIKAIREEETLLSAKSQKMTTSAGSGRSSGSASVYLARTPLEAPGEMDSKTPSTAEALTQAITQMVQSNSTLQQAFTEIQRSMMQVIETQAGMQQSMADLQRAIAHPTPEGSPLSRGIKSRRYSAGVECFNCGQTGHYRAQCPKPRHSRTLTEEVRQALQDLLPAKPAENFRGPR